ncbi:hypothetical protein EMEDMD4_960020 [Sinorhizobium medicae]|uniref:IS110 family transposase n=1 Tax=Sinorhizobium medicae TaxID=110321 RepID=A0A508X8R2_9HYPH|nr:hypothetical protein EMEDMD4_960020 [Sinorhizobium medicae]
MSSLWQGPCRGPGRCGLQCRRYRSYPTACRRQRKPVSEARHPDRDRPFRDISLPIRPSRLRYGTRNVASGQRPRRRSTRTKPLRLGKSRPRLSPKAGRIQLAQVNVSEIDRIQIDRVLAFIGDIDVRIKPSEATIRAMTKANGNVKLLKTIPGIGEFFPRLIDAEIDDIARFRNRRSLPPVPTLYPRPIPVAARPSMARSSNGATSGCAGRSSRRSRRPLSAMHNGAPSTNT